MNRPLVATNNLLGTQLAGASDPLTAVGKRGHFQELSDYLMKLLTNLWLRLDRAHGSSDDTGDVSQVSWQDHSIRCLG